MLKVEPEEPMSPLSFIVLCRLSDRDDHCEFNVKIVVFPDTTVQ